MKKIIFTLIIVCAVTLYSQAQFKPEAGSITTELQFNPFNNGGNAAFEDMGLRGRYFLSEQLAVRLNLDFGMASGKNVSKDLNNNDVTAKTKASMFGIAPGIEYHLGSFERISPYVGAEIAFNTSGGKYTEEGKDYSIEAKNLMYDENTGSVSREFSTSFGLNLVLGVDVYIVEGLYMGAELGLGFGVEKLKPGELSVSQGSVSNVTKFEDKISGTGVAFNCVPQIRLGWRF